MGYVPVSVFSCLLYLAMITSLWMREAWVIWLRSLLSWILLVAAIWFIGLQFFILRTVCPYCMAVHGFGVGIAFVALTSRAGGQGAAARYGLSWTLLPAILLVASLALIQFYGPSPDTHRLDKSHLDVFDEVAIPVGDVATITDVHSAGEGRVLSFMRHSKTYRVEPLPHLGRVDATHVLIKYFDYTCEACHEMHEYLDALMLKYPSQLALIVLPVPLERDCNLYMPVGLEDHANACKLARLSLRVWRAQPEAFAEFHQTLFECSKQPYEVAEAAAYSLVDPDKMDAVDASWIESVLQQNIKDYAYLARDTPVMPKLLIKESVLLNGKTKDIDTLNILLEQELKLK